MYNTDKELPNIPSINNDTKLKQLQMIDESFEDVTLDLDIEKYQNKVLKRGLSQRKSYPKRSMYHQRVSNYSVDKVNSSHDQLISVSPTKFQPPPVILTPSQKLRIRRKQLNQDLENSIRHEHSAQQQQQQKNKDIDSLSDDELPDDFIVYNVPLSRSLKALSTKEQFIMNQPFANHYTPNSVYNLPTSELEERSSSMTDSNRSSVFSYNSSISTLTDESLSNDLKFFTIELNKNIDMIQHEESQQRIFHLKKMMTRQQDRDSVYSNNSTSSLVSDSTAKYFSSTRPSNLPPKDKFESLKHSKDYESLLTSAMQKEIDKSNLQANFIKSTTKQRELDHKRWVEILPNLHQNLSKTSTRELWWRGIPQNLRLQIWCKQIGNHLKISNDEVILLFQEIGKDVDNEIMNKMNLYCYPNLSIFQDNTTLYKIIKAYLMYTNTKKQDNGIFSLAAVLYHNIRDPIKTFIALSNILHRKLPYSFIHEEYENEYLTRQITSFNKIFHKKIERLYVHFQIYKLESSVFLRQLCSYCLTQYLDFTKSCKLIDIYIFEGDSFLLRCVLGFLSKIDYKLFGNKQEIMDLLGENCLINLNKHLFETRKTTELIYGFKYLDLGLDEEFFQCIRNILRD